MKKEFFQLLVREILNEVSPLQSWRHLMRPEDYAIHVMPNRHTGTLHAMYVLVMVVAVPLSASTLPVHHWRRACCLDKME